MEKPIAIAVYSEPSTGNLKKKQLFTQKQIEDIRACQDRDIKLQKCVIIAADMLGEELNT